MATELAKAYIQIVPSAQGIKGSITNALSGESEEAGEKAGFTIGAKIVGAIAVAGIGKALSASIMEGAKLQQSIGGIETLFKSSADKMKQYANVAYQTAGLSANSYMEQATSFSASLLSSLNGNTKKAAEAANGAIIDMSDNANKMGTSIDMIQNAYQGFAKQNYTMLDNLKLGYGGTKTEMERLLKDAQKISGVKYDIKNLGDVYSAIHVVQKKLGITGTTAKEAASTFSGSFDSMKASLSNFLGNLSLGEDIKPALNALIKTTSTFLFDNLIPMVGNVFKQIPNILTTIGPDFISKGMQLLQNISTGFVQGFPNLMTSFLDILQNVGDFLTANVPIFIQKGFEILSNLVQGVINAIPVIIQKLPQVITTFANIINDNFPTILAKGAQLLWQLVTGILQSIPTLIANIPQIINAIVSSLMAFNWLNLGKTILTFFTSGIKGMVSTVGEAGKKVFEAVINWIKDLPTTLMNLGKNALSSFGKSITNATGTISGAIKGTFNAVVNGIIGLPSKMLSIGGDVVKGLWKGIGDAKNWILDKISGFVDGIVGGIKGFFGIHSPSKVFDEEVGKMLSLGLAQGIEDNLNPVKQAMKELEAETTGTIGTDFNVSSSSMVSVQSENTNYLLAIINLLSMILKSEGKEFVMNLNNREVCRALKDLGVVFE